MYKIRPLLAALVVGALLNGCSATPEAQPQASAAAAPATTEAEPAPASSVPASEPILVPAQATAPATAQKPKPRYKRVKPRTQQVAVAAPVEPAPVEPAAAGPTEQEMAAALSAVDAALKGMVLEQARFTAPATMQVGTPAAATLSFESAAALDAVRSTLAADPVVTKAGVQVSGRVEAQLKGEGIAAKANSPAVQELMPNGPSKWQWELQAAAAGKQKLHLTIGVETTIGGSAAVRSIHTFDKEVTVGGGAPAADGGFFSWWWILILVVLAAVGVWVAKRRT